MPQSWLLPKLWLQMGHGYGMRKETRHGKVKGLETKGREIDQSSREIKIDGYR